MVATKPAKHQKTIPLLSDEDKKAVQTETLAGASAAETKQLSTGLSSDELRKRAEENEADRTEKFRDRFELLSLWTLNIVWLILMVFGITWAIHIVLPDKWHFISFDQFDKLQTFLTGSVIAGIASGQTKRRLSNANGDETNF